MWFIHYNILYSLYFLSVSQYEKFYFIHIHFIKLVKHSKMYYYSISFQGNTMDAKKKFAPDWFVVFICGNDISIEMYIFILIHHCYSLFLYLSVYEGGKIYKWLIWFNHWRCGTTKIGQLSDSHTEFIRMKSVCC